MSKWQPIETAPKDGTEVDLWVENERGDGWRESDAYWVEGRPVDPYDSRKGTKDGWYAPNHDYDNQPGWCCIERTNTLTGQISFIRATHWKPLPPPPESE